MILFTFGQPKLDSLQISRTKNTIKPFIFYLLG